MASISFSSGLKKYTFEGDGGSVEVSFNPTDATVLERISTAFERLDDAQREYEGRLGTLKTSKEIFAAVHEMDDLARATIDGIFEQPVSETLYGDVSMISITDGVPLWADFLLIVVELMDDSSGKEAKKKNPRLEKYINRYKQAKQ